MSQSPQPSQSRDIETRARKSLGASNDAIYKMVARVIETRGIEGKRFVDVGCGGGKLWDFVSHKFEFYTGVDAVRYNGFPEQRESCRRQYPQGV